MRVSCFEFVTLEPERAQIMFEQRWLIYAILSAVCASFVAIFGKVGMQEVDTNLATTVRSVVMTLFLLGFCTVLGLWSKLSTLHPRALTMIALSGLAGALSWLFYFKAIHIGAISQVAPIDKMSVPLTVILALLLLGERPSALNWLGVLLVAAGGYLAAVKFHA
jgi:transporter family protein